MAKQFSKFLYDGILQEQAFQVLFNELLISYAAILIDKPLTKYDEKFSKLLRYADILSLLRCRRISKYRTTNCNNSFSSIP